MWRLKRALYGLKNAPKLWQQHLASRLELKDFQRMKSDPSLHFHTKRKIYLLCYVDDLMLFGEQKALADLVVDLQKELLLRVTAELSEARKPPSSDAACGGRRLQLLCRCSWRLLARQLRLRHRCT